MCACVCVCVCARVCVCVNVCRGPLCASHLVVRLSLSPSRSLYGVLLHCQHHGALCATAHATAKRHPHEHRSCRYSLLILPPCPLRASFSSPPMDIYSSYSQHRYVQPTLSSTLLLHSAISPSPHPLLAHSSLFSLLENVPLRCLLLPRLCLFPSSSSLYLCAFSFSFFLSVSVSPPSTSISST